jgi:hypothetical protein
MLCKITWKPHDDHETVVASWVQDGSTLLKTVWSGYMYFYAPSARVISTEIMLSLQTRTKLKHANITKFKKKSKLNRNTKTTETIKFSHIMYWYAIYGVHVHDDKNNL